MAEKTLPAGVDAGKQLQSLKAEMAVAIACFEQAQDSLHSAIADRKNATLAEVRAQRAHREADMRVIELGTRIEILTSLFDDEPQAKKSSKWDRRYDEDRGGLIKLTKIQKETIDSIERQGEILVIGCSQRGKQVISLYKKHEELFFSQSWL